MAYTKEERLERTLLDRINVAEKFQENSKWVKHYKRIKGYVKGDYGKNGYDNKYIINTFYNLENLLMPNLYYQDPYIRVKPARKYLPKKRGDGYVFLNSGESSVIMEKVLNQEYKIMNIGTELHQCIKDSLEAGFGILKVGLYQSTETEPDDSYLDEKDEIFGQRVHPLDFLWDPMATSITDARYLIHRISKPLSEVKDNKNYKNTSKLRSCTLPDLDPKKEKQTESKDISKYVVLYELHDLVKNKIYTCVKQDLKIQTSGLTILWEREIKRPYKGSDFIMLRFLNGTDCFEGISPLYMIEDEALAMNEVISLMIKHLQRFPGVILYEDGSIEEADLDQFQKGLQGDLLKTGHDALRTNRVERVSPLSMGQEYFGVLSILQGLVDRILGVPDFQRPVYGGKRKSATEVVAETNDQSVRRSYLVSFVKDFILDAVEKIATMIQKYAPDDLEVDMGGELGYEWIKIDKQAITDYKFFYDLDINELRLYSASSVNNLVSFLNVLGQNEKLQPVLEELDPKKIAEKIAEGLDINVDSIKKTKSISHTESDPYKENELADMNKRVPDPQVGEPHQQHIPIHQQKYMVLMQNNNIKGAEELKRHIEMTQYLEQVEAYMKNPQGQQLALQQGQQASPQQGMMNQGAGPSEAEQQGGFTYNQDMGVPS